MSTPTAVAEGPRTAEHLAIRVGLVAAAGSWRPALQAYLEHHVDGVDVIVIRDPHLIADELLDLVVIDDASTVVGPAELALLAERSIPVVGLHHRDGSGRGDGHLHALGVKQTLPADTDVVELARMISGRAPVSALPKIIGGADRGVQDDSGDDSGDDSADGAATDVHRRQLDADANEVASPARIVTVGGVSERRHELGALLASGYGRAQQSMVIDLDPYRPRLARRFRLQLQPNVLVACRSIGAGFDPMHFTGRRTVSSVELPFWSLVGVPAPETAAQIEATDLAQVVEQMSRTWPRLVLVADGATGNSDARAMRKVAVRTAATLIVATDPTPEGVLECLDWLVQTDVIADRHVVADIVVCGRPHSRPRRIEIAEQLREHRPGGTVRHVVFLPWNDAHVIAASWEGRQIYRRSKMARATRRLAQLVSDGATKRLEVL